jgi:fibronectin-binding autotransporter adhesin
MSVPYGVGIRYAVRLIPSNYRTCSINCVMKKLFKCLPTFALRSLSASLALCAIFGFNSQTLAATYSWAGSTDGNWADENWLLGGTLTPAVPGSGDTAIFNNAGNGNTAISLGSGVTVQNILFDTNNVAAYTIGTGAVGSQSLVLNDAGSILVTYPVTQSETIDAALTLGTDGSAQTYLFGDNSSSANLTFAGNITGGTGGTAGAELLDVVGTGNTAISGVVSNGGAISVGIVKSGAGTLTLSGANTYSGTTTVGNGTLDLNFNASGAPTSNIVGGGALSLGGTLLVNGNAATANSQSFSGTTLTSGQSTIGAVNNGTSPTINLAGITVSGAQGGGGATLEISSTGTVATVTTTTLGAGALGLLGTGVGANSTAGYATYGLYDWATTDTTAGTVGTAPATIRGLGSVTGGYVNAVNGTGQGSNLDLTANISLGGNSGNTTIRFNTPAATTLNVNGKWYIVSGVLVTPNMGAVNAQISGGNWFGDYSQTNAQNIYVWQNNTQGFFINSGGMINGRGSTGATQYIQSGVGTVLQAGSVNAYTGQTYLNGGYDVIGNNQGLGAVATGATLNLNGGTLVGNATFSLDNGGNNLRAVVVGTAGGGIAATAGNTLTVDGQISGAAGTGPLIIGIPASSANGNSVTGLLPGTGAGTANVTGTNATGTVVLNNATGNTFSGGVNIVGGATLNINSEFQLGGANYGGTTFNNGTLQYNSTLLNAVTDISQNSAATPVAKSVTFAGNATIDTNGHAITYANTIGSGGAGGLTVANSNGTGSLTLSAPSTFVGAVTVNSGASLILGAANAWTGATTLNGKLSLNSGASLANTLITVNSGATLQANTGNGGIGTGTGASVTLNVGSTLSLQDGAIGVLALNGNLTINGGSTASIGFDFNGTSIDVLNVSGGVSGTGLANIFINNLGGTAPTNGQQYTLINAASGLGTSLFTLGTTSFTFGSQAYRLTLSASTGTAEILTANFASLNYYWTGGASSSWSSLSNFATDHTGATVQTTPISNTSNIFLTADAGVTGNYNQTLDGNVTINSLSFTGGSSGAASNSITLASGGAGNDVLTINGANTFTDSSANSYVNTGIVDQAGSAAHTISANINLGGSQTWEIDSSNALLVSGTVADGTTADSLTKTGNGTLVLSANNTYDGGTTVSAGTLKLGVSNALLSTGAVTVKGTGALDLAGFNQSIGSLSDGGVSTGTITSSAGGSNLNINGSSNGAFSGAITGAINITQNSSGTLTLSGSNAYTGLTTLNAGNLVAANNYALGSSTSATGGLLLTPSTGTSTVYFTSSNPGIASLASSGAGTSSIVLGNGVANTPTSLTITGTGAGAGTTFSGSISDLSGVHSGAVGSLILTGGNLALSGANTFAGSLVVNGGNLTIINALAAQDATLNLQSGTAVIGAIPTSLTLAGLAGTQNFALTNSAATPAAVPLTLGGSAMTDTYTGNLSGLGGVTMSGTNTQQFGSGSSGGASYSGATIVNAGTLILGGTGIVTGSFTVSGLSAGVLDVQDTATVDSTSPLYLVTDAGGFAISAQMTVKNSASVTSSGFAFGNGTGRLGGSNFLTIQDSAIYMDNGTFDFLNTDGGTGTQGNTVVNLNGGTLAVQNFILTNPGGNAASGGILDLNGGTIKALANDAANSSTYFLPSIATLAVDVQAGGAVINTNGFGITIASVLAHGGGTPDGGLTVSNTAVSTGTLTLTGVNTYTGPTTINTSATLQLGNGTTGNDGTIATSSSITDNGNLIYNRFGAQSSTLAISGTGNVEVEGPGSQTLAGTSGYTGSTTVTGTLIVSGGITATSRLAINGGTVELRAANAINGAAHLSLEGGTLTTLANQTEALGDLTLGSSVSTLTLGAMGSVIDFADSTANAANWTGTLAIQDWNGNGADLNGGGTDELFIGSAADLTQQQIADITFVNPTVDGVAYTSSFSATQLSDGEIVALAAVPEPGTWASLLSGLGMLLVWRRVRRRSF